MTMSSAGTSSAGLAASTACAVPRRSRCTNIVASGSTRLASAATTSWPGPITTAVAPIPASAMAPSTWASSERPATSCMTLGRAERMRVPSPAASTIARQLRAFIGNLRGALIAEPADIESRDPPLRPRASRCGQLRPWRQHGSGPLRSANLTENRIRTRIHAESAKFLASIRQGASPEPRPEPSS